VKEGEAIVRIKTDLKHKDSSVRDFWIAKIVDDPTRHPNKKTHKLHVWPAYNLASAVDDHDMKINFMVRGQEHRANEDKQRFICEYMGWEHPHTMYHGKISKLGDMVLSKSKMKIIMDKEGILSYDDPRMATMKAFRRRGIRPQTVRKLIFESGIGMNEVKIDMKMIAAYNKEFVGSVKEYPFFSEAVGVEIYNFVPGNVMNYGEEVVFDAPIETILVDKKELSKFKADDIVRFKKGFNVKFTQVTEYGAKAQFISYEKREAPTLSWLKGTSDVEVLLTDGTTKVGVSSLKILEEKEMVRFEDFGYASFDNKKGKFVFSYE
jgi:glutamyl-tRNA synthetase